MDIAIAKSFADQVSREELLSHALDLAESARAEADESTYLEGPALDYHLGRAGAFAAASRAYAALLAATVPADFEPEGEG